MIRSLVERYAKEHGCSRITPDLVDEVKGEVRAAMMSELEFRALAGQSTIWLIVKTTHLPYCCRACRSLSVAKGLALAIIIVFMGVTGPTIRLVTMKMGGYL